MKEMKNTSKARRYVLVLNNYKQKGDNRDTIIKKCQKMDTKYFCLSMEVGDNGTEHCHIYLHFENPRSFNAIKKEFTYAHIEKALGTARDNYLYVRKEEQFQERAHTSIEGTFYEEGDSDVLLEKGSKESKGNRNEKIVKALEEGKSCYAIALEYGYIMSYIKEVRANYINEKYKNKKKENMSNTYISGVAGTGKTSYFHNHYTDGFRTSDFVHGLDMYDFENAVCFDEYHSDMPITQLLDYMNEYTPQLKCRYYNKLGIYENFVIISNLNIEEQYKDVQDKKPETYCAFLRRFEKIVVYTGYLKYEEYSLHDYLEEFKDNFNPKIFCTLWMKNNYPDLFRNTIVLS